MNTVWNHCKGTWANPDKGGYRPLLYTNTRFHHIYEIGRAVLFVDFAGSIITRLGNRKVNSRSC